MKKKDPPTTTEELHELIQKMADKWPSAIVSRMQVGTFTGGLLNPGTMRKLDCLRQGPKFQVKAGGYVAYPTEELCRWLIEDYRLEFHIPQPKPVPEILRK